ncbi:MAG: ATP-dependent Clp protease ATP-binding subunit [Desulfamplus sp.]|nr:ATP-dependent Clp protease ATP-binding subunit [Desulfamplus sp.]
MKDFFSGTNLSLTETELSFDPTDIVESLEESLVIFSKQNVLELREDAGDRPVTPLIVQQMLQSIKQGYFQNIDKVRLYKVASEILINGKGRVKLFSRGGNIVAELDSPFSKIEPLPEDDEAFGDLDFSSNQEDFSSDQKVSPKSRGADSDRALLVVKYNDPIEEMETLVADLISQGKIPVLWSKARGIILKHLSKQYPLFSDINASKTADPKEIIRFIINRPQVRVAYILEDFHHYIGEKDVVNPSVGEIRSLIKELNRALTDRSEREDEVYLFVPASYDMPPELAIFFSKSSKVARRAEGYLDRYAQLLTDAQYLKNTKPLIGAELTIARLVQVLSQMEINNPLIVGYPGVGKTAVVEGLARAILSGTLSSRISGKHIYSLSLNSLIAGTKYRGELEIRLQGLMDEVLCQKDRVIIFIDEIHTLIDAGSTEGAMGASEFLKPLLARGEFPCIGATTFEGAELFSKDPALARRFKKIIVNEPKFDEAVEILRGVAPNFEHHHAVSIDDGAIIAAIKLSKSYLPDEYLPGKAISLIDGACSYCNMVHKSRVTTEDIKMEIKRLHTA